MARPSWRVFDNPNAIFRQEFFELRTKIKFRFFLVDSGSDF